MLLTGKTVLVVEPEPFAAYALERRLWDLDAKDVVVLRDLDDARLRYAGSHGEGAGMPNLAIIDFDEASTTATELAAALRRRRIKVVRTSRERPGTSGTQVAGGSAAKETRSLASAIPTVRKPYGMVEIERAIGRHYGILI